jgi:hypothetical protein
MFSAACSKVPNHVPEREVINGSKVPEPSRPDERLQYLEIGRGAMAEDG